MYLIDTSAWREYLSKTGSDTNNLVRRLLTHGEHVCITEPITMEILAGASDQAVLMRLERLVDGLPLIPIDPRVDYRDAARLYRVARQHGFAIHTLTSCLMASIALRRGATLVHCEPDFDIIARVVPAFQALRK